MCMFELVKVAGKTEVDLLANNPAWRCSIAIRINECSALGWTYRST